MFEIVLRIAFFLIGVIAGFIIGIIVAAMNQADKELKDNKEGYYDENIE